MKRITLLLIVTSLIGTYTAKAQDDPSTAIDLMVGAVFSDFSIVGSNVGATASEVADPTIPYPSCSSYLGSDVWYTVEIPAEGFVSVETKEADGSVTDTGMTIYEGSIGALVEVECNDDGGDDFFSLITVTDRTPGEVLFIRVFTYDNDEMGEFQIAAYATVASPNDACTSATIITNLPFFTNENDVAATNNDGFITVCGTGPNAMNDGLWYTFIGDGTETLVRVLPVVGDDWDPEIGVYSGSDCANLVCVDFVDDSGDDDAERLLITTIAGETYYVNIGHFSAINDNLEGNFKVFIGDLPVADNDLCEDAIEVTTFPYENFQEFYDTSGGLISGDCDMNNGVWYTIEGTGNPVTISVDVVSEEWDPAIGFFSGSCAALVCEDVEDGDSSGDDERGTFPTIAGETYFINVGHWSANNDVEEGDFTITIEFLDFAVNDLCENAILVSSLPYFNEQVDFIVEPSDVIDVCPDDSIGDGVWYELIGNGQETTVTVTPGFDWFVQVGIFTGDCNTLVCEALEFDGFDSVQEVTFTALNGVTYLINVGSGSNTIWNPAEDFTISITAPITCPEAQNITFAPTDTTVEANWDLVPEASNGYIVSVYLEGDDPIPANVVAQEIVGAAVDSATLIDLMPDTNYDGYVVSDCDVEGMSNATPVNFTTESLGVTELNVDAFKIYPNPTSSQLTISGTQAISEIQLFNLLGQELVSLTPHAQKVDLDLSNLSIGTYLMKISTSNGTAVKKIVKN